MNKGIKDFSKFLSLSEDDRFELLTEYMDIKLTMWQKLEIRLLNRWWSSMVKNNPHIPPYILFESVKKGRF